MDIFFMLLLSGIIAAAFIANYHFQWLMGGHPIVLHLEVKQHTQPQKICYLNGPVKAGGSVTAVREDDVELILA